MDFGNNRKKKNNIFNKEYVNPKYVYDKILNNKDVNNYEVQYLNMIVSEVNVETI